MAKKPPLSTDVTVRVQYNHFPKIAKGLRPKAKRLVAKTAFDIQARAVQNATSQGVFDTGALVASIFASTAESDTYGQAVGAARSRNPEAEVYGAVQPGELRAYVGVGVVYGAYNEYGTFAMSARPFFVPAVEAIRPNFLRAMREIVNK